MLGPHIPEVLRIARRYGAKEVRVFGSVARHEATPASDVDLLVCRANRRSDFIGMSIKLAQLLGRRVDVVSEGSLHWYSQPQIIAEAIPL